jgi:hypothetical protein
MGYIKLADGSSYSDPSYTLRCFSFDTVATLVGQKDLQYHGTAYGLGSVNSLEYVYSTARENWTGRPGGTTTVTPISNLTQTALSGSSFPQYPPTVQPSSPLGYKNETLDHLTQNIITLLYGSDQPVSLNADNYFNPGINFEVEAGTAFGTTTFESTYLDNLRSGFMNTDAQDFYIQMPIWGWPGTAVAGTGNSITFSSSPTYDSSQTVTVPFSSTALVNSFSSSGDINFKLKRSALTNGSIGPGTVDLSNMRRIKITVGPALSGSGYLFKTGQMKVVPTTYSHYKTNVDTKQGVLKMERWGSGISQQDMPAIVQDGYTVKNFKNIAKIIIDTSIFDPLGASGIFYSDELGIIGSPLPDPTDPHVLSIFSRVHPNRSSYSNLYLETRLEVDKDKVAIKLLEGNSIILTSSKTGTIPSGTYYMITTYEDDYQNVQLFKGDENFAQDLYFETGKKVIANAWLNGTGNKNDYGGYSSGYGYSGYQFKPKSGNIYLDYIYTQDVVLSEYESKTFESSLPVQAATLFPTGNADTELLTLGQSGFEKVLSSDNFKKGTNEIGNLDTDVVVSNDISTVYPNGVNTSSIKVTKTSQSYISSLQYGEVLRVPNFSKLTFKTKIKYEDTLKDGKFKIVFWDSAKKKIAFIQEITNITPNQWYDLEIPLVSSVLYNDRLIFEIGHFGNAPSSGSFWIQDPSLTTESVEWSLSSNDGLQYTPVLTAISDQYKSVNFPNNRFYSVLLNDGPSLFYNFDNRDDTGHIFGGKTDLTISNEFPKGINNGSALPISAATASPSFVYPLTMPATINTFTSGQTYDIPKCVNSLARDNFISLYGTGRIQTNSISGFANTNLSYFVWFYAGEDQYGRSLGQSEGTSTYDWRLGLVGGTAGGPRLSFKYNSGAGTWSSSVPSTNGTATWADNNWHQFGFTYESSSYHKFYYDGKLISTQSASSFPISILNGPFYVLGPENGGTAQIPTFSDGIYTVDTSVPSTWINTIVAYNKILTNDQIEEQYIAAISEYNKLKVRARAYTKDAWIAGYELIPKYAHLGRLLDKPVGQENNNQIIFDQSRFDVAKFSDS